MAQILGQLQRGEVLARIGLCLLAVAAIFVVLRGWEPPFEYRASYIPPRDVAARVKFQESNPRATEEAQERALSQVPYVYRQDPAPLEQLRFSLKTQIQGMLDAATFADLPIETWRQFQVPVTDGGMPPTREQEEERFQKIREAISSEAALAKFEQGLAKAFEPFERNGVLDKLPAEHVDGNQKELTVYPVGKVHLQHLVQVSDVLIGDASSLKKQLDQHLSSPALADSVFAWLRPRLVGNIGTLVLDEEETQKAREKARLAVPPAYNHYQVGQVLAKAGKPLGVEGLALLRLEHAEYLQRLSWTAILNRSVAMLGLILALAALCAHYVLNHSPTVLAKMQRYITLLVMLVATMILARWCAVDPWRAEAIPLVIFGLTCGIAYNREVALLFASSAAILLVMSGGHGLGEFIVLAGTVASAVLMLGNIRTRTRLISIGFYAGAISLILTVGVGVLDGQPLELPLLIRAIWNGLWAFAAGFAMTGLLPFVENRFGVLTDLRLLEFGDVSHPLLQELVRRAPGTYNHSINVASIAEAAAESIGARGLLVRVGAYFHDIGKMCKPSYFVENQGPGGNRHDSLVPAMSTLIIIAHIKDGADLARQHKLPEPIIDFIEQHHGTTLVEYFFRRANEQSIANPDGGGVQENAFRYPGPKPQTKEAAVLMLADAVESASRALNQTTPSRIENLVEEIAMKRLLDGQFDECGLTLKELRLLEDSLVKSLTAVYHGRVKYPDQRTA